MASSGQSPTGELGRVDSLLIAPSVERESLSTALAETLAARKGLEPTDAAFRLLEHIDPEALDGLFDHTGRGGRADWRLEFEVGDETVVVHSNGFIQFGQLEPGEDR